MAIQYFDDEYIEYCKKLSPEQTLRFLEEFRLLNQKPGRSKLISIKVPENLLEAFKHRCRMRGTRYQTQIKRLMNEWVQG